jgi:DNA polymerase
MIDKQTQLDQVAAEVKNFKGLEIAKKCTQAVPGEGNPDAQIMFIGEAPGFNEDRQGRPFVGQAGKLLEKVIQENLGLRRPDVYITNIVKYRPPDNRDPLPEEIEACKSWLDRQIQIIKPQIITTLGRFSMAKFIPDVTISKVHGQPRYVNFFDQKILIFPMYHPAAALRAGAVMTEFVNDFDKLRSFISPPVVPAEQPLTQPSLF